MIRPLHAIDFYKADHKNQYPTNTEYVYSNFTPRSNRLSNTGAKKVVFFGLQAFILKFLNDDFNRGFFERPKEEVVAEYKRRMDTSLGQGAITVEHIEALHDLGFLPIKIKALPEGSVVPMGVPGLTIVNTMKEFFWITNYLESSISACLWKGCTSATTAYEYRKLLDSFAEQTGAPKELVPFQGHDFSFRGMSGFEDAISSGMGHLLSFVGTDSVLAIDALEDYYFGDATKELLGCSVPATEHSVMCMGGKEETSSTGELNTFKRLLDIYPSGIISIVSDTWDFFKVLTEYVPILKEKILNREPIFDAEGNFIQPGKTVFRPDSGDPVHILTGYTCYSPEKKHEYAKIIKNRAKILGYEAFEFKGKYYKLEKDTGVEYSEISKAEVKGAVEVLWDEFGGTITDKGYKLLDEHVGLIYGDSITLERATQILSRLEKKGFASTNVVLGIGSYTYEYVTRDTYGFAMKATWGQVNGEWREIFKDPATDSGTKKSAKGLLKVIKEKDEFKLLDQQETDEGGELKTVFLDGKLVSSSSISEIRSRLLES